MGTRPNHLPRAERYAIPIAILYRSPGELDWQPGLTENISRSGVLFRADRRLEPNTPLEMLLDLPTLIAAPASGTSLRRGRVVRAIAPSIIEDRPAVAAAFIDFQHTPPIDPRRI
jgi:PilZ domain-containing protein